ncbi:MAG: hypothetical protein H0T62_01860 [Parachlamydiaceae bacterium]|nr:hypothetical protein [Parachlamydiaceae bacterium]
MQALNTTFLPNPNQIFEMKSQTDIQKSTEEFVDQMINDQLDLMPQVPKNIRMRISDLVIAAKLRPNDFNLKKDLFFLGTSHLYSTFPLSSEKKIVVMGKVVNDGIGDYYHILNAAESIKNKFQDAKVTMFIYHCSDNLPDVVRKPMDAQIGTFFCKREVEPINRRTINNYSQIFPILRSVDQILEVSQKTLISYELEKQTREKYKFIGEYGTTRYENNDVEKSMGLNQSDLGIIIRDKPSTSSLLDLNNDKLKQILFSTTQPLKNDLEAYLKTHEPFVGYLKLGSYYQMAFI